MFLLVVFVAGFRSAMCAVLLQFVIVEFLNKFAQTTKLPVKWWILCIIIGLISYASTP